MHLVKANVRLPLYYVAADASMNQAPRLGYWARGGDCAWDRQQPQPRSRPPTTCAQGASSHRPHPAGSPQEPRQVNAHPLLPERRASRGTRRWEPSVNPACTGPRRPRTLTTTGFAGRRAECLRFPQNHHRQGSLGLSGVNPGSLGNRKRPWPTARSTWEELCQNSAEGSSPLIWKAQA